MRWQPTESAEICGLHYGSQDSVELGSFGSTGAQALLCACFHAFKTHTAHVIRNVMLRMCLSDSGESITSKTVRRIRDVIMNIRNPNPSRVLGKRNALDDLNV